jgi:hypothetical protein
VSVFVVLPCETLDVVIARLNGAFLWSLILVGEHMRLQILEYLAAFGIGTSPLFSGLFTAEVVAAVGVVRDERMSSL